MSKLLKAARATVKLVAEAALVRDFAVNTYDGYKKRQEAREQAR